MAYSRRASIMAAKRKRSIKRRLTMGIRRKSAGMKLARFAQSRFRMRRGRALARKMNLAAETKLCPCTSKNEVGPVAIQNLAIASVRGFVVGGLPTQWDAYLEDLGGTTIPRGTTNHQRTGNFIYLKKTHLCFQVDMNQVKVFRPPIEFRMIIAKARRANTPAGTVNLPQTSLFLGLDGSSFGHETNQVNGMDLMNQPLNKRDWVVFKDRKFVLTHPAMFTSEAGVVPRVESATNSKYPTRKTFKVNLNYFKKTRLDTVTNMPEDIDTHYLIYFYASTMGKDGDADGWEISTRGVTSYTDM